MVDLISTIRPVVDASGAAQGFQRMAAAGQDSAGRIVESQERVKRSLVAGEAGIERLRRQYVDGYSAAARFASVQENLNRQLALGRTTQAEVTQITEAARTRLIGHTAALDGVAKASGSASAAARQFGIQSIDVFQGLATGAPIMTTFIQQGAQVGQVMANSGASIREVGASLRTGLGSALSAVLSPVGLVVAGVTAASASVIAVGYAAETAARRIGELGNRLSLIRTDYAAAAKAGDDAAKRLAASSFLTTGEARGGINAALQAGITSPETAARVTLEMSRLALRIGDIGEAAKLTGDVVKNPAGFIETLLKANPRGLVEINQQLLNSVRDLTSAGKTGEAFAKTMEAIARQNKLGGDDLTEMQKALRDLENAFTGAGQSGKGFLETVGAPVVSWAASAVSGLTTLVTAVRDLGGTLSGIQVPAWLSRLGGAAAQGLSTAINPIGGVLDLLRGGGGSIAPGLGASDRRDLQVPSLTGNIPLESTRLIYETGLRLGMSQGLTDFATRIAAAESGGNQFAKGGGVLTSSAGALGMMQVMPGSAPRGLNLADTAQNIEAGMRIIADLDKKFGGDFAKIAVGYNAGPGRVGSAALPTETLRYLNTLGLQRPQATAQAAGTGFGGAFTPPGTQDLLRELDTGIRGTPFQRARETADELKKVRDLLAGTGVTGAERSGLAQRAGELEKALYDAVTAGDAAIRSANIQVTSEERLAAAWGRGAEEAAKVTIRIKAESEARQAAGGSGSNYLAVADRLTASYTAQAAALGQITAAQQASGTRDAAAVVALETRMLTENDRERTLAVAHLKDEQGLKLQYAAAPQYVDGLLKQNDALRAQQYELQKNAESINAVAGMFSQSFDTIGNAITQSFLGGTGAAVNWGNVMRSVLAQVIQMMIKLAVVNPLQNELFGTKLPTLSSLGSALSSGGGFLSGASGTASALAGASDAALAAQVTSVLPIGHSGWHVGMEPPPALRMVSPAAFASAPRFHSGLGGDEFAAVLQRGERVLTAPQQRQAVAAARGDAPVTVNINLPPGANPDTFRRSRGQIARQMSDTILRARQQVAA